MSTNPGDGASGSSWRQCFAVRPSFTAIIELIWSRRYSQWCWHHPATYKGQGQRKKALPPTTPVPAKKVKPFDVAFYLLPKQSEKTPKEQEQLVHMQAGLGRRTAHIDERTTHEELCDALKALFPKLETITGGWLLYKSSGGWGSGKLSLVPPDDTGYTGILLKSVARGTKNLYIVPLQEELATDPLPLTDEAFRNMPKATCQKCETVVPIPLLTEHIKCCNVTDDNSDKNMENVDVSEPEQRQCWLIVSDPSMAISQCAESFLRLHESKSYVLLSMDIRRSPAVQDMALIPFYKRPNVEWCRHLNCKLEGDTATGHGVTRFFFSTFMAKLISGFCISFANSHLTQLFEGEPGHLVPSASHFLVESDMFLVAGRMIGHSFLHGGPHLQGLSPAVTHVFLGGSPETATVTLEDCPNLDIWETIVLFEGESTLSDKEKQSVQDLTLAWDLPLLTHNNRRWLFEKLLIHAVIGRVMRQIKQLRRGIKETPMWTLLTQRPDTVALLFPKDTAVNVSAEALLQHITWPCEDDSDDDDDVNEVK